MDDMNYESKVESVWDRGILDRSHSLERVPDASIRDLSIATYLYDVYKNGNQTDAEFAVSNELGSESQMFSAHKLILSLWSTYFADMFYGPKQNIENIITIKGVDPKAFRTVLRFMYGLVPPMKTCKEILEIYKVSERFNLQHFQDVARNRIKRIQPDIRNVFQLLEASIYMDLRSMKMHCLEVIQENTAEIFESVPSHEVKLISAPIIGEILNLRQFSLESEYELIEWIFNWAKNQFYSDHKYSSVHEAIKKFLPKLHFVSLSSQKFAQFYKIHESFFDQDDAFKILMNIAIPNSVPLPEWQDSEFNFRVYKK